MVFVTFYYCLRTVDKPDDGGGYCGHTASGITVHKGSAACESSQLGKRFVFSQDPDKLVFICEDTGSAVGSGHVDLWYQTNSEGYASPFMGTSEIIWQD
jgi:3D (Asp-Asp-Asp) domain-containing protein